jgi:hypothetical protein
MTVNAQYGAQMGALLSNFVAPSATTAATAASITFFPSAASPYQETAGIIAVQPGLQLTLASPLSAAHNGTCIITQPSGKVWGPYISADTFKVAYIPATDLNGSQLGGPGVKPPIGGYGQAVLLDRWGQVIQYFPTYGTVSNRTNDSVLLAANPTWKTTPPTAGPLYGYSQPMSIDTKNGQNAIWDSRDGMPFFTVATASGAIAWTDPVSGVGLVYCKQWPDPTAAPPEPNNFYPNLAIQWMLGDAQPGLPASQTGDVITGSDKLSYTGPYILISAGPNGPSGSANSKGGLNLGGFCNLVDSSGNLLSADTWQQIFINSGNIYNFDRQ